MSQNTSPMTNSFLSSNTKYGGMVKKSSSKIIRNSLLLLISYIDSSSPHFFSLHIVITFFRIFQLLGPTLFAASVRIWPSGELHQKIISYSSILYHIIPVEYRYQSAYIIEIIYIILIIFYYVLVLTSAFIYKDTSKLPKPVVILISILNGSVMYLIHPIALQMASQEVSRLIMGMDTYCNKIIDIVLAVLTYVFALFYAYTFAKVMSITLLFRPTSLLSTLHNPQLIVISSTYVITILSGISTYLSKIPFIILSILTAIAIGFTTYVVFLPASFVRSSDMRLVFSTCVSGALNSLIVTIFAAIDKKASLIVLFIIIAVFVIAMIASYPIIDNYEKGCLKTLDIIAEDQNVADHFHHPSHLIRDVCIGYKYAHPVCLDWSVFKAGSEIWQKSGDIWSTFGKFVAIYPEENNLLSYIIHSIETKKIKGNLTKQTIAQGRMVLTQRESSLSSQLKRKMQHVGKAVHHSKRKLRHIWDLVIQGNTHEMESAVNSSYKTINKTEAEFIHVLSEYPNNRFIARSYARFLQEVKADSKGFHEWVEKVKILQRGIHATVDNTHILGIEAFPNLPHILTVTNEGKNVQITGETESAFQLDVDIEDDPVNENMSNIREQIKSLKIPSLRCVTFMSIIVFLVFIVAPVIAIFFVANDYKETLNQPLEFMYYLSYLRTLASQLPSFSFHSIFEDYPPKDPVFEKPDFSDINLSAFGYYTTTKDQYNFLIKELTTNLEAIGKFRAYGNDKPLIQPATDRTFKSILNYKFYTEKGNYTELNVSVQSALMDYSIQLTKLSSIENVTNSTLVSPIVMNPLVNTETVNNAISFSIESIVNYLREIKDNMGNLMLYVFIGLVIFFVIFYTVLIVVEMKKIQLNKHEIYSCLTSLPKNVVSALAESLRVLKKDTEGTRTTEVDTEFSKQEDNILKLFAAAGDDSSSHSFDRYVVILCNILLLVIDIVLCFLLTDMFKKVTTKLVENGPHLDYVFGAIAYMIEALNNVNLACTIDNEAFNYTKNSTTLLIYSRTYVDYFTYFYQRARYGGNLTNDPPFPYFAEVDREAEEIYSCENPDAIPITYKDIYTCFTPDQQTTLFVGLVEKLALPVILGNQSALNKSDQLFTDLWYASAILLYQSFFNPMFESILPQLKNIIDSTIPDTLPIVIVLVVLAFVIVIVLNAMISFDIKRLKFALSLLLHCQSNVIMQTQKIIDVLNGHFTSKGKESTTRNQRFFTEVVWNLPDSIIVINNQFVITAANKSTERIYSLQSADLVGTKINTFLTSPNFSDNMSDLITKAAPVAVAVTPTVAEYKKEGGTTNHLELSCILFNQNYVLTTRDVTRMFVYNTLIDEERAKSDKLLASILPPSMVVRVQRGEKNISFAVQSATILFLDIVSFTPWCASNTAAMVMQTLNNMFKLMDTKLATHATATKIKCIGDCYMCAGGIFDEINQPNVHAKEIVEFGLESLECMRELDQTYGLELKIRVGINTGGPIVAGVLGTEKPTFEILGPAINMAQQMEHHGVPMQVHISRSVYELVYGGSFVIKERGQIEIKSGKVITYLVHDPKAP